MEPVIGITGQSVDKGRAGTLGGCYMDPGYLQSVEQLGGMPVILPPVLSEEAPWRLLRHLDALLISDEEEFPVLPQSSGLGGSSKSQEDPRTSQDVGKRRISPTDELLRYALQRKAFPILGIGKGMERIHSILGGTFCPPREGSEEGSLTPGLSQKIHLQRQSALYRMIQREYIWVQGCQGKEIISVGAGLLINARGADGRAVGIESVEDRFLLGILWHPEKSAPVEGGNDVYSRRIFQCFIQQAQLFAQRKHV